MEKPNIIMIIAEELGQDFLSYAGNPDSSTPFLNQLSEKGVTFCNHFTVHGKCVPSRGALYSGRYCHNGGHRTLGIHLQENEISLARELKEHGYQTILIGKNHTIDDSILADQFDHHWRGGINGRKSIGYAAYNEQTTSNCRQKGDPRADNYLFGKLNLREDQVIDYAHTERLCDFIKCGEKGKPFFANLNFNYTHPPYEIMEPYYSQFMSKDLTLFPEGTGLNKPAFMYELSKLYGFDRLSKQDRKELLACYYGQLAFVDNRVREIYETLEQQNMLDNTIFIFTADHGDLVGQHGITEKWDTIFTDSIMKIPLIIHYPPLFKGKKLDTITENIDILPTLLELLGIKAPYGIQGRSLLPVATGNQSEHKKYAFAEGGHEKELLDIEIEPDEFRQIVVGYLNKALMRDKFPDSLRKAKMIRTKDYKLVYRIKDKNELYDMKNDKYEHTNLYDDDRYKKTVEELEKILLDHLIESEENLPFDPVPIS